MGNIVTFVDVKDWDKDGTIVKVSNVTFDDNTTVPGYDLPPGIELDKPLPQGWEVAQSKAGKPYIKVPKAGGGFGGGKASWSQSEAGARFIQERMDRRTSVMQAVAIDGDWEGLADRIYYWLRATATGVVSPSPVAAGAGEATPSSAAPAPASTPKAKDEGPNPWEKALAGGDKEYGEGSSPSGECIHVELSMLKPDGAALPKGLVRCLSCGVVTKGEVPVK